MQVQHHPNRVGRHGLQRLCNQHLNFQIEKDATDPCQHDVRRPRLRGDAQQAEFERQEIGVFPHMLNIGVDARHKSGDNFFSSRVVEAILLLQVAAKAQQPRPDIAFQGFRPLDLGHCSSDTPAPDLKLEQAVSCGVIALGEKQVVLILGIDVGNAPAVGQDFDRLAETGEAQCFHSILLNARLRHDRGSTQGRREPGGDTQEESKQRCSFCNRRHSRSCHPPSLGHASSIGGNTSGVI